jgi:hypothetical protein
MEQQEEAAEHEVAWCAGLVSMECVLVDVGAPPYNAPHRLVLHRTTCCTY